MVSLSASKPVRSGLIFVLVLIFIHTDLKENQTVLEPSDPEVYMSTPEILIERKVRRVRPSSFIDKRHVSSTMLKITNRRKK